MTDPTADAAKLLPCPSCKSEKPEWRRAYVADGKVQTCRDPYHDTRPQPAPPAGEPEDIDWIARVLRSHCRCDKTQNECCDYCQAASAVVRLGLAARPKVEDAEVALVIDKLRRALGWSKTRDGLCQQAADLLERLSADLRAKETQLAQADAVIERWTNPPSFHPHTKWWNEALERHRSRQQGRRRNDEAQE